MPRRLGVVGSWCVSALVWVQLAVGCGEEADPGASNPAPGTSDAAAESDGGDGFTDGGSDGGRDAGDGSTSDPQVNPAILCPLTAPSREEWGDALEALPGAAGIGSFVASDAGVFFIKQDAIHRLSDDGQTATLVVEVASPGDLVGGPGGLAFRGVVDGVEGLWGLPLPASGAGPNLLASGVTLLDALALDATHAYFYYDVDSPRGLARAPLAGGELSLLDTEPFGIADIATGGGYVYYAERLEDVLMRIPSGGGTVEPLTTDNFAGFVRRLLLDEDAIYVAGNIGIDRHDLADPASGELILRFESRASGGDNSAVRMLDAGDRVVFVDELDNVGWVAKDGSDCGYVAVGFTEGGGWQTDIALDDEYLYLYDAAPPWQLYRLPRSAAGL